MHDHVIPDSVKQFFLDHIDSVAQWEGLLLLRSQPHIKWSGEDVARHLYITPEEAERILSQLAGKGFAKGEGGLHYYALRSPALEPLVTQAATVYGQYLVAITNLIHTKAKSRMQEFANAFRLRKD